MTRRNQRGVTLMELLIAVTLLSLLIAGGLTAMRVGTDALRKTNARVTANRRVVGAQRILEQQLAGFIPVTAECIGGGGPAPAGKIGFFQGETQTLRFVSSYSLDSGTRGTARILEFQVIPGENERGVRLVVNEHLYTGSFSAGRFCLGLGPDPAAGISLPRFTPVETGPGSFVLADKLEYCRFFYREPLPPPLFERWMARWVLPERYPTAIRIEMAPLEADAARIGLMSLTVPVFVNRVPMGIYGDY